MHPAGGVRLFKRGCNPKAHSLAEGSGRPLERRNLGKGDIVGGHTLIGVGKTG